jgi:hypothetical protein
MSVFPAVEAYRRHGLSVQGMLPAYMAARDDDARCNWADALAEHGGVPAHLAYRVTSDLIRAAASARLQIVNMKGNPHRHG